MSREDFENREKGGECYDFVVQVVKNRVSRGMEPDFHGFSSLVLQKKPGSNVEMINQIIEEVVAMEANS